MKSIRRKAPIALAAVALLTCKAHADTAQHPIDYARSLQMLQDQVLQGSTGALGGQQRVLASMAGQLASLGAGPWTDPRQVRAAAIYLLSGGTPRAVRDLLGKNADIGPAKPLILALLAYAEQRQDAQQQLLRFDAMTLDPSIAGHVALAQAIVSADTPAKAMGYLATARLLAPGTLIEESALRREIRLLVTLGQHAQATDLATRYLWRFRASLYAHEVLELISERMLSGLSRASETQRNVGRFLDEASPPVRQDLLLSIARANVREGKLDIAAFASERAVGARDVAPPDRERGRLYAAISRTLDPSAEAGISDLGRIDRALLGPEDKGLSDAAIAVAHRVRSALIAEPAESGSPSPPVIQAREVIARAEQSLAEANP